MHEHEVDTSAALVARLIAAQFPEWANLRLEPVRSTGTDHTLVRLGDEMVVRLPRVHWALAQLDKERQWLPHLVPHLPVTIPVQLATGEPGEGYPWRWSICRWLEGETVTADSLADPDRAARDLAQFIGALQRIDPANGPRPEPGEVDRGLPLSTRNTRTRDAIAAMGDTIDADAALAAWDAALAAPEWTRAPVWFHGDLLPGNLLFTNDRLSGVIDFGLLGVGDPACDLMIAWNLFSADARQTFRAALDFDDATWARGRGWALSQAAIFIPYYLTTNPEGVARARRAIEEVLADART